MGKNLPKKEYRQVQFLAWEIHTGPVRDDDSNAIDYSGIQLLDNGRRVDRRWDVLAQCIDIEARLAATKRALETALLWADPDETVLKIFMAPEFLYRGPAGAYINDLLDGWEGPSPFRDGVLPPPFHQNWGGLFGGLRALAADPQFDNWIFVFGTAIGAAFASADAIAVNISLVQLGGAGHQDDCYYVEKHLKSTIDFVEFNLDHPYCFGGEVKHDSRADQWILDRLIYDNGAMGGCLFSFPTVCRSSGAALRFGLEICLDHARSYASNDPEARTGRLALSGEQVDIQLVPSCGMSLFESSLSLTSVLGRRGISYAYNCDGLESLNSGKWGGHIQLWHQEDTPDGGYQTTVVQEVESFYDDPDQTPPPDDDPAQSRHFGVSDDEIDLSGLIQLSAEIQESLGIDLREISPYTLWRSHMDYRSGRNPHLIDWPKGLGFIRRLPPVPL